MKKLLWDELGLTSKFMREEVDLAYQNKKEKTPRITLAWKVLRDKYYGELYREYRDEELLIKAGFLEDKLCFEEMNYEKLNLLVTPFDKLKKGKYKKPVVLLSTGGFYPIHEGHLLMMEKAKEELEKDGYVVIGGYLSLSHEEYISTKPYYVCDQYERIKAGCEVLKDSDWIMIDPFESLYVKTTINFTTVIERLEKYLRKYVDEKIQVAYVFGGDNAYFMYCFLKKGIGICLNRSGYSKEFLEVKKIKNNRTYFIDNIDYINLSSRNIREKIVRKKIIYNGNYLIRNEGLLPLLNIIKKDNKILGELQKEFLTKMCSLFYNSFDGNIKIKVMDMEKQLNRAREELRLKKTINLDSYYRGDYNIELSRLFGISSYQDKYISLVGRMGCESLNKQLSKIKKGNYTLVDDDSVSGNTLKNVLELLDKEVIVEDVYLLANTMNEDIFDIVDLRDFLIGVKDSGLVVELPNGVITRAPYVLPYVNLGTRASIPTGLEREFSIKVWEYNKEFYEKYDSNICLGDLDNSFIILMEYVGFKKNDSIIDICKWHIKNLT